MASRIEDFINLRGEYGVGNLNSWEMEQVNEGAYVADEKIENFTMVELFFENEDTSDSTSPIIRKCKQLTDVTKPQYLIASVERRVDYSPIFTEELCDFYNKKGEQAGIFHIPVGKRFETSSFKMCEESGKEVTEIKNGMGAYFDPTEKKFVVVDLSKAPDNYTNSSTKLVVVANGDELATLCGKQLIRFEVIA